MDDYESNFYTYDPSAAEREYLYQVLHKIEGISPHPSSVVVVAERNMENGQYRVAYFILFENQKLKVEAMAAGLFTAADQASDQLEQVLEKIYLASPIAKERDAKLNLVLGRRSFQ